MKGRLRWYLVTNAVFCGVILGVILFWQAAEAPQYQVHSSEEAPAGEPSQVTQLEVPVLAGINRLEEPSRLEESRRPVAPPPAVVSPTVVSASVVPSDVRTVRVPILMYHRIDWLPPNPDPLRRSLSISPTDFDSQIRFLKDRGFVSVSLQDVYEALQGKRNLPPKPVVLTFDDGYTDNYVNAFPVLKKHDFTGTFFILTDVAGTGEYMTWEQLKEMAAGGLSIEVHGRTHLDLSKMNAAGVASQVMGARDAIRARIGVTPMFYSYPSGRYNQDVINVVRASGFLAAVTTNYGRDHTLQKAFELSRVRIDGRESFAGFVKRVEG